MSGLKILAWFGGLVAVLATAGCGNGGNGGSSSVADARDVIVGTWAGTATPTSAHTIGSALTFQVLKGTGGTGVEGAYQISVPVGASSIIVRVRLAPLPARMQTINSQERSRHLWTPTEYRLQRHPAGRWNCLSSVRQYEVRPSRRSLLPVFGTLS